MSDKDAAAVGSFRLPTSPETARPDITRVYYYNLGSKDNFQVDRDFWDEMLDIAPNQAKLATESRAWLHRAVRFLASDRGITQFLDLGAGMPTDQDTHDVAQEFAPKNVVVYVDNDETCAVYGRALLEQNLNTHYLHADIRHPDAVLQAPEVRANLDFTEPVGLIISATLQHFSDAEDPWALVARYVDALPSGSYLALSHFWSPDDGSEFAARAAEFQGRVLERLGSAYPRTQEQILRFFRGLELVEPGVVEVSQWWPAGPAVEPVTWEQRLVLGGVARKP